MPRLLQDAFECEEVAGHDLTAELMPPARIGLNLFEFSSPSARGGGVARYVTGLLEGLAAIDCHNHYYLFLSPEAADHFKISASNFTNVIVPLDGNVRCFRVLWEQVLFPIYAKRYSLDVVHCPSDSISLLLANRSVVTSHAANLFYYQRRFPDNATGWKQRYLMLMQRCIRDARFIIAVSQHSRRELIDCIGVTPDKVRVIYHAPDARRTIADGRPFSFPYILDVSSSVVHKNLPALFRAYGVLKQRLPSAPKLVIAGSIPERPQWAMYTRAELVDQLCELGLQDDVRLLPDLSDRELDALYQHAELFVFPSLYEGFGFVVLEAMSHGVPAVISRRASLPEVGGDAAVYIDPEDPASIAGAIERVLKNHQLRSEMVIRGRSQVEAFGDWQRVARQTLEVYSAVAAHVRG